MTHMHVTSYDAWGVFFFCIITKKKINWKCSQASKVTKIGKSTCRQLELKCQDSYMGKREQTSTSCPLTPQHSWAMLTLQHAHAPSPNQQNANV